jgi:hypothetical protein
MKTMMITFFLPALVWAAQSMPLPQDARSLYIIASPTLIRVSEGTRQVLDQQGEPYSRATSLATISLPLRGCLDAAGPFTYRLQGPDRWGKLFVEVTAYGIDRRASDRVACLVQPTVDITVDLKRTDIEADQVVVTSPQSFELPPKH